MAQCTVLISEDSPTVLLALSIGARALGMDVISDKASCAYELAKAHRPHVVLLDICQQVGAPELLRRLKADPETRSIVVVVMTAGWHAQERRLCAELGAEYCEMKPVQADFWTRLTQLATLQADEVALQEVT